MVTRRRLSVLIVVALLTAPAYADRAGDAYKRGLAAEKQAHLDEAFGYFKQAFTLSPHDGKYFTAFTRVRFGASQQHLQRPDPPKHGLAARSIGRIPKGSRH